MREPKRVVVVNDYQIERAQRIWIGATAEELLRDNRIIASTPYVIRDLEEMEWIMHNTMPRDFQGILRRTWTPIILEGKTPILTQGYGSWTSSSRFNI